MKVKALLVVPLLLREIYEEGIMNFLEVAKECIGTPELVKEFNRLYGCGLGVDRRAPIERMIDEATGYPYGAATKDDLGKFVAFVYEFIWLPLAGRSMRLRLND